MDLYCDYNATAPLLDSVKSAMISSFDVGWGNSFSQHSIGRKAAVLVDEAREHVAKLLNVPATHVRFTSGASESNAWVLYHFMKQGPILCSAVEHPSVYEYTEHHIPTDHNGVVCLESLKMQIRDLKPALISVMAANNETGVVQPIQEIYTMAQSAGIAFHCDASQVIGKIDMALTADYITLSAHKFGGPKGVGALVIQNELKPLILGGPQERLSRAGTHNVHAIVGMGEAARLVDHVFPSIKTLEQTVEALGGKILGKDVI